MTNQRITWRQRIVLQAASDVDYLPLRARRQINFAYGVFSSLVDRGLLRSVPTGWELTPEGREKIQLMEVRNDTR